MIDLLLFDLDGTVVDSGKDIIANVNRALHSCDLPIHAEANISKCIGRGIHNLFRDLLGETAPLILIDKLVGNFKTFYARNLTECTTIYPGIVEMLEHYSKYPKVIVTNKTQTAADGVIDVLGLRQYFVGVFGYEAFSAPKPDAAPILGICEKWKVPTKRAALVGDSIVDMTAGKAAGVMTVAALYGYGDDEKILAMQPNYTIKSAIELIGIF